MTRPFPPTRIWGAVWTDDGPIAEVRDVLTREDFDATLDAQDFRWWAICAIDALSNKGHSKGGCVPGRPCQKCEDKAARWWFEHGRRTKARLYHVALRAAKTDNGWDVRLWGDSTTDRHEALQWARHGGYPVICLMDGHGHRIEWIEVVEGVRA